MVKLADNEFKEIINNFDEFMAIHGYLTIEAMADKVGICATSMYVQIENGRVGGIVKVGRKKYIPATWKRSKYRNVPEGYLTVEDTAKKWFCTSSCVRHLIYDKKLTDYIKIGKKTYIKKDAEYPLGVIMSNTPEGYATIKEIARKLDCAESTIRNKIKIGEIPKEDLKYEKHHWYIRNSADVKIKRPVPKLKVASK